MKTHRPVKLVNTREETFTLNGPRLETNIYLKTAVTSDGKITAREGRSIFDVGAYLGPGRTPVWATGWEPDIPNFRLRSYGVYTNKVYVGSYRASGVADMTFAVESHMDVVAHRLGIDPWSSGRRNALKEGDVGVSGARIPRHGLAEVMEALEQKMDMPEAKAGVQRKTARKGCPWNRNCRRGMAQRKRAVDGIHQRQRRRHRGLLTGSVDISGSDTSLAQIAAEVLGRRWSR